jgi:hypothetical protein
MTLEDFISKRFADRLRQRRLIVIHDPKGRYREVVFGMADDHTTVLDCGGDLLEAREKALESLAALGEDSTCKRRLALYVPVARSLEDADLCADPFAAFVAAGAVFPDGVGDDYRQLCLQFLPEQSGVIEGMFATGDAPAISVINSLRSGAVDSPVLRDALDAEGPKDMLVKFLTAEGNTLKGLKAASHWVKDLKDLVARTLGLKLEGPKEAVEQLQEQLWRYLLFSEFVADLPVELPPALVTVPRAGKAQESFVRSLCATLRDLGKAQQAYEEAAMQVSGQLGLESLCSGIEDFGELDTFSFEERSFLRRFAGELKAGEFENARTIVVRRRGSFWVERDARRSAEWQLADLAARLMLELESLTGELAAKRTLDGWIDFYTESFAKVDSVHRAMEQVAAEISPVASPLLEVLAQAREAHRDACDGLARKFQQEAVTSGWPSTAVPRAVDTFDRWVEPRWKAGERVAYFWIDALRYELAMALEASLSSQHATKLETVCASMPCLTPVGMASLLPGAPSLLEIAVEDGKPLARMNGKTIAGPKERYEVLAAHVGVNRTCLADLEDIVNGKMPEDLDSIEVLAVKTTDIDSLGENNPLYFIAMLPGILRKIQIAVNHLADAGFSRAIIATDHGFGWMFATSAGNAVGKPPGGEWMMNKDRALLGEGAADSNSWVTSAADAGIRSLIKQIAVPKGMATYTAGVTYFHGGLSPQECILPVIDVRLKPTQAIEKSQRIDINLTYRGANRGSVTTLLPSMELSYPAADLFGPASVRLVLMATDNSGKTVGEAGSSAAVDPGSREINLERGKAIKVPLRLQEGFEGEFKVIAADPSTGAAYATIKLKTEFHH